jgi:prepilin-type N-terminal cleavage/methylation domain-containing protein
LPRRLVRAFQTRGRSDFRGTIEACYGIRTLCARSFASRPRLGSELELWTLLSGATLAYPVAGPAVGFKRLGATLPARYLTHPPSVNRTRRHERRRRRAAYTLIELLVVLVLLGLGTLLVLPMFRAPVDGSASAGDRPVERARTLALRRGEAVRLTISKDGAWQVRSVRDTSPELLLEGVASLTTTEALPAALEITALGACLPDDDSGRLKGRLWDPTRCAVAAPRSSGEDDPA